MKAKIKKFLEFLLITSLVILAFMLSKTDAQNLSGGISAGVSTGSVKFSDIPGGFANVVKGDNILGLQGGVYGKLALSPFYIKPMLLVNFRHGSVDIYESETVVQSTKFTMDKLEIPLLFGFRILGPLSVEAGPVYNYILHSTNNFDGNSVELKKSGLGYRAGAGVELGRVNLNVSYQGLTLKSMDESSESTFQCPYELIFGIGINLGKY